MCQRNRSDFRFGIGNFCNAHHLHEASGSGEMILPAEFLNALTIQLMGIAREIKQTLIAEGDPGAAAEGNGVNSKKIGAAA